MKDAPPTDENPNNKVIDIVGSYEFTTPEGKGKFACAFLCDTSHFKSSNYILWNFTKKIILLTGRTYRVEYVAGTAGFLPKVTIVN